ncbi:hypothetical protein TPB0596_08460 [Tsukamurella pulmonis]|uniref:DUF2530 domain-containing protein n=1 Tax=Tsukamurella pulmonis TaxID=47312 RepID=A0A1H1HAS2_9ACTN|nr:DUF2530 domain-containing protein [Tsukamurella pulmonis]KXO94890.1 hypothetical protein AXK56_20035 [Tsukamurella pulmonis]KXP12914.1 hypothetical protein AXK57_01305 [Tsukamurella pulmonis]RDH12928.1 DUF2530 domain-containing protein [Tsukamurella pulmonis]SDR22557.1 Protein of unknown function [Tsukamurella pulmonis]SUP15381.1 Protein of uncharacterised function (DUF2530) [Tsukamurella pulmonis]
MSLQANEPEPAVTAPPLPRALTEARPVVLVGTALFAAFFVITFLARETFGQAWVVCACGVGVGVLGATVLTLQRRAALRGDRGAQRGLV